MSFTKLYASKFVSNLLCELADHFQIDHDKIQNHVVSSNRKRVQCAKPNNVDILRQQRDELVTESPS